MTTKGGAQKGKGDGFRWGCQALAFRATRCGKDITSTSPLTHVGFHTVVGVGHEKRGSQNCCVVTGGGVGLAGGPSKGSFLKACLLPKHGSH